MQTQEVKHVNKKRKANNPNNKSLLDSDLFYYLIKMIFDTLKAGKINPSVYKYRALMMISFKHVTLTEKEQNIDCSCDIGDLMKQLFTNKP